MPPGGARRPPCRRGACGTRCRRPGRLRGSSVYLAEYHDELIARLRSQEADAARAAADAASAAEDHAIAFGQVKDLSEAVAAAKADGDADRVARYTEAFVASREDALAKQAKADMAAERVHYLMDALQEWRKFVREPLRMTREEMRQRGMLLPALPTDIDLGEEGGG